LHSNSTSFWCILTRKSSDWTMKSFSFELFSVDLQILFGVTQKVRPLKQALEVLRLRNPSRLADTRRREFHRQNTGETSNWLSEMEFNARTGKPTNSKIIGR
jgi:hypothetical protein